MCKRHSPVKQTNKQTRTTARDRCRLLNLSWRLLYCRRSRTPPGPWRLAALTNFDHYQRARANREGIRWMRRAVRARGRALNARWDTVSSRAKLQRAKCTAENLRTPPGIQRIVEEVGARVQKNSSGEPFR